MIFKVVLAADRGENRETGGLTKTTRKRITTQFVGGKIKDPAVERKVRRKDNTLTSEGPAVEGKVRRNDNRNDNTSTSTLYYKVCINVLTSHDDKAIF
jgi:hypothetical protein